MSGNYRNAWRGIAADRLPAHVWRAQYARITSARDIERERIAHIQARSTDASGEGIEPASEGETGDTGEPIGE